MASPGFGAAALMMELSRKARACADAALAVLPAFATVGAAAARAHAPPPRRARPRRGNTPAITLRLHTRRNLRPCGSHARAHSVCANAVSHLVRRAQVKSLTDAVADLEKRLRLKGEELALAQNADAMLREQLKARFALASPSDVLLLRPCFCALLRACAPHARARRTRLLTWHC
jgi:hypothetical protein